jgi:translation initiation factor IF-1
MNSNDSAFNPGFCREIRLESLLIWSFPWTDGCKYFLHFRRISSFYHVSNLFMGSEQPIELEGTVRTILPGTMFRVTLDNQHEVLAHMSGKMRKHFVRLTIGDRVRMEMSPYDLTKARITYRLH